MIVFSTWRPRPGRYCRADRAAPPPCAWLEASPFPCPWLGVVGGMASPSASWAALTSAQGPYQLVPGVVAGQGLHGGRRACPVASGSVITVSYPHRRRGLRHPP